MDGKSTISSFEISNIDVKMRFDYIFDQNWVLYTVEPKQNTRCHVLRRKTGLLDTGEFFGGVVYLAGS